MADIDLNLTIRPYDYLQPLLIGHVSTPGVRLTADHRAPLTLDFKDAQLAAEVSFNRYVFARAKGDDSLIGLPAFILRGFRHRNFFVRRDSARLTRRPRYADGHGRSALADDRMAVCCRSRYILQ